MNIRDSVFTTHVFDIRLKSFTESFDIYPFGDIHWGSSAFELDRFNAFVKSTVVPGRQSFYLYMGDTHDSISGSERKAWVGANFHETTYEKFDSLAAKECDEFSSHIKPMHGKIIGMVQGNHDWMFMSADEKAGYMRGDSGTQYLCRKLGTTWLGCLSYIRLRVFADAERCCKDRKKPPTSADSHVNIDLVVSHGKAGGKLVGSSVNQVDDLRRIFPLADVYIMGHNHDRGAWPITALYAADIDRHTCMPKIKQKEQWLVRSGSFLKGYEVGKDSYVVNRLLRPSQLGGVQLSCKVNRRCSLEGPHTREAQIKVTA